MTKDEIKAFVTYLAAKDSNANIESYVKRGRKFQALDDDELRTVFVEQMRKWALAPPPWTFLERLRDADSEFELRNLAVPFADVTDYIEKISHVLDEAQTTTDIGNSLHLDRELLEYQQKKYQS